VKEVEWRPVDVVIYVSFINQINSWLDMMRLSPWTPPCRLQQNHRLWPQLACSRVAIHKANILLSTHFYHPCQCQIHQSFPSSPILLQSVSFMSATLRKSWEVRASDLPPTKRWEAYFMSLRGSRFNSLHMAMRIRVHKPQTQVQLNLLLCNTVYSHS
jgi:hypothetical protein